MDPFRDQTLAIRTATEAGDTAIAALEADLKAGKVSPQTDALIAASARLRARAARLAGYPDGEV
jgi:hypothetical protein